MLATLLLSRGTPMLLAGDEFGRTQGGNNNAYCQDNEISWLNWNLDERGQSLQHFVTHLTQLRRRLPILYRSRFLTAEWNEELGLKDMTWIKPDGAEMDQGAWDDPNTRCLGIVLDGRAQVSGIRRRGQDATVLVVINSYHDGVPFTLPPVPGGTGWRCLVDTNLDAASDDIFTIGHDYIATGRSLLLFELSNDDAYSEARAPAPAVQ